MGEGEGGAVQSRRNDAKVGTETMAPDGGGGQDEDLLGPPSPSSPPTEKRGDFVRLCLFNYGLLSNSENLSLTAVSPPSLEDCVAE